ncbi:MAG: hypothetical protein R3B09_15480 [Nannocystaceae bacterium]
MAPALRHTAWVYVVGCALPDRPPDPPPAPPAPAPATPTSRPRATSPALPAWEPTRDARAAAELKALEARAERLLELHRTMDEDDSRAPLLILDLIAVFEEAGRLGSALRLLFYLRRIDPERATAARVDDRIFSHLRRVLDEHQAASALLARACGATIIDPPAWAAAPALLAVAECLDEDRFLFAVSLRYRRLAAERGADRRNAAKIEALEAFRATVEKDLAKLSDPARRLPVDARAE